MVTEPADAVPARDEALAARARRIRLVLTDCDGVLTDGGVYYSESGESMKRFNVRDGMGVERLRERGIAVAMVSREGAPSVRKRAEKLRMAGTYFDVPDKREALEEILREQQCRLEETACIGDDLNDLELLRAVGTEGLTGAPSDAMPEVLQAVHFRASRPGGAGAFREFVEWILALRGDHTAVS